ncbi:MAG: PAS domain-containing protein, partial [Planctomycetota bacterium]
MKTLLAVSDPATRASVAQILSRRGHTVIPADHAAGALRVFDQEKPDLVLLDDALTGMDPLEVCRKFRESPHGKRAVIVALTSRSTAAALEELGGAGVDDFARKPPDAAELHGRMALAETRSRTHPENRWETVQLWKSAQRLRQVLDSAPALVWTTDRDLRFTASFGGSVKEFALRPQQIVGMTMQEYFGSEDPKAPAIAAHRRALKGESARYDGTWRGRSFQAHVQPLLDADGKIAGCAGFALEVEESRDRDAEADALARATVDALPERVGVLDREGTLLAVNDAWRRHAETGSFLGAACALGASYLEACEATPGAAGV